MTPSPNKPRRAAPIQADCCRQRDPPTAAFDHACTAVLPQHLPGPRSLFQHITITPTAAAGSHTRRTLLAISATRPTATGRHTPSRDEALSSRLPCLLCCTCTGLAAVSPR